MKQTKKRQFSEISKKSFRSVIRFDKNRTKYDLIFV